MAWSLVQQQVNQTTSGTSSLPAASTAGNLLIICATSSSNTALVPPSGFSVVASIVNGTVSQTAILASFNTVGGQSSFVTTGGSGVNQSEAAEFTCPGIASVSAASDTGTATAGAVGSISVSSGGTALINDLVILAAFEHMASAAAITWTDPPGFTEISNLSLISTSNHGYGARALAAAAGGVQSATVTSSVVSTSSTGWTAAIATFRQPPSAPHSAISQYGALF